MNKLIKSAVLTLGAAGFLMAAPAVKKVQNQPTAKTGVAKKHVKKVKAAKANKQSTAAANSAPAK